MAHAKKGEDKTNPHAKRALEAFMRGDNKTRESEIGKLRNTTKTCRQKGLEETYYRKPKKS